jgi:hypothetical protein
MPTPFLSSEEYDERAHALYNEGKYDDALALLRRCGRHGERLNRLMRGFDYRRPHRYVIMIM